MNEVALYVQARQLISTIATATNLFDIKKISNQAEAMQHYAQIAKDPQLECWIAEVRIRALRRIGELSAALPRATGENLPNVAVSGKLGKRAELEAAGISKDQAHKCEKLARISAPEIEAYITSKRDAGEAVTADEVIRG